MRVFPSRPKRFPSIFLFVMVISLLLSPVDVDAKVVRIEVTSRKVVSKSPDHSRSGPYEQIKGMLYLEVDPDDPANQQIVDIKLARRNRRGNVEFSTEFELHKPVDASLGNHRLLYFVNNRGNRLGNYGFNYQAGKNWLYSEGWSYLWCGWNCDVIPSDRALNINVPVATESGKPITGKVLCEIYSYADEIVYSQPLVWGGSLPYPPVDMDDSNATLTKRPYRWEDPVKIPRDSWSFARLENDRVIPNPGYLYIKEGFTPGWLYDLVYTAKDPKLTGLGLAAIRDVVSFFKYEDSDKRGIINPLADAVVHAYAWGHSQSARLLNHFVYQDFNGDEQKRLVFDGIIANCPGAGKGLFNSRFAQTTRHGSHLEDHLYPIDFFPFTTVEQVDPITGERGDNLALARKSGFLPKIFYINTSTDYWTRAASLLHTDVEGKTDVAIDSDVRMYMIAGRAHTDARVGFVGRALLVALDLWITQGVKPPESQIPKILDGTLVDLEAYRKVVPAIPGLQVPESFYHPIRLNPGSRWRSEGIADFVPPKIGLRYVCLIPQVDEEGCELAGIHLPEISVPLATFMGWSLRSPSFSHTIRRNAGSVWPLPYSEADRKKINDPRRSILERYPTKSDYLAKAAKKILELKHQGFLLDEDVSILLNQAALQSDWIGNMRFIEDIAIEEGAKAGFAYFNKLREADILWWYGLSDSQFNNRMNSKGYELMKDGKLELALEVFKLNSMIFGRDYNVWDSLAECYFKMEKYDLSKKYYERSLKLNPDNTNAEKMLDKIKEKT